MLGHYTPRNDSRREYANIPPPTNLDTNRNRNFGGRPGKFTKILKRTLCHAIFADFYMNIFYYIFTSRSFFIRTT